ncbi:hypothetical protein R9X49_11220 [Pectobacterium carotovorum]|uniref:hypothetical protein n=1 Tax=Pectobacterium carotovorum TaxID=554 RepID=UPI0029DC82CA|nr:hypothetical protein [Pectobacterium carotovorum]MDX6915677.1 hypothetical protein [Pectobacterium carotovorum]
MNTLTNEAIKSRIEALRNSHAQNKNAITSTYLVDAKALEELLSLRALLAAYDKAAKEPVAYIVQDKYERESGKAGYLSYSPASKYISDTDINAHEITCTPLFKNAPMPVVIDDVLSAAKKIVREFEEAERNRGPIRDRYINPMTRKEEINHIMVSIPKIRSLAAAILQGARND